MDMVLATNNRHKAEEFRRLFPGSRILLPADAGVVFRYEETGATYLENALGKAAGLFRRVSAPVIADDSGLSVASLAGEPGVLSARYGSRPGGPDLPAAERNRLLLSRLEGVEDRRAFFVCCLVLMVEDYRFFVAQETVEGVIAREPRGTGGFGYDPVFYLPALGKTVAELEDAQKDRVSHRGRAAARITGIVRDL